MTTAPNETPILALLPWGDVIEDFLEGIGVSVEVFATEMTGGWLFGYVEALQRAGVRTVLVCVSAAATEPVRYTHRPTGTPVWILPAPKRYLRLRRRMRKPHAWTLEDMFGPSGRLGRVRNRVIRDVAPYLALPPRLLARTLRRERCTAILCQEYEDPRFDLIAAVGRRLGLPVYATFQGGDWHRSRLERLVRPRTLRASAGFIVPTSTERMRLQTRYGVPDAKIASIFNPIAVGDWAPADRNRTRAALGVPAQARLAVWHGRVDLHRKGLDILLDAWAEVVRTHADIEAHLLLVGTGESADELRALLDAEAFRTVTWIDEYVLDRARLRDYLTASDAYVFPSRHEGFPVALVEALAAGLPVATTDAPGVPDILGDSSAGIVVPTGDAPALAEALGHLLADAALADRMATSARQRARTAFSLDAVGDQLRTFLFG